MTQVARCNTPRRASEVASIVQVDERSRRTRMPIADFRHPAAVGAPSACVGFKQSRRRRDCAPFAAITAAIQDAANSGAAPASRESTLHDLQTENLHWCGSLRRLRRRHLEQYRFGRRRRRETGRDVGRPHVVGPYGNDEKANADEARDGRAYGEAGHHVVRPHGAGSAEGIAPICEREAVFANQAPAASMV
jgi:hypothetical protein